jgi:hypothetical protein
MSNIETFCILLRENSNKCAYMQEVYKKHSYIKFFPAFYWKTNFEKAVNLFINLDLKLTHETMSMGAFCIWMSNIKLWITCLKDYSDKDYFIILEDDVVLPNNFISLVKKYYIDNGLADKYGGIMLCPQKKFNCIGTLYTKKQLEKILDHIKTHPISEVLDVYLIQRHRLIYRLLPNIVDYNRHIESVRTASNNFKRLVKVRQLIERVRKHRLKNKDENNI